MIADYEMSVYSQHYCRYSPTYTLQTETLEDNVFVTLFLS